MANFFASYDLNGKTPTHAQMDAHLRKIAGRVLRVVETVWYINTPASKSDLHAYIKSILSANDRVLLIEASGAMWNNLLVPDSTLIGVWNT